MTQVLIAGAGPTGLTLALWLSRLGVPLRIIDKAAEPGTTSRALVMHARTLEFDRQIGLAETLIARGQEFVAANLWVRGKRRVRVPLGAIGKGLSPFPYVLILPQDEHERILIDRLRDIGVEVERRTEITGFDANGARVLARLRAADGRDETCEAAFLAGCDGAHSTVRQGLGIGFPGGTYAHVFFVADVEASGPAITGELHVALDDADFLAVFPMKGTSRARLVGTVQQGAVADARRLSWQDVSAAAIERLRIDIERVNWFSTYHVHHRVADRFRKGRVFLAGDAAHIHSPVGGQGMNTGIGDAVNLSWKLAAVVQGSARPSLLDSYEPERIAFAQRLVATTDKAFTIVTSPGRLARFVRTEVVPLILPRLVACKRFRGLMFRTVSQIAVDYRTSPLSAGRAGNIRGGDRLPWVQPDAAQDVDNDNFAPLTSLGWQVHVYGDSNPKLAHTCAAMDLPLHVFPWRRAAQEAGLKHDALYLVRPDGYVALAAGGNEAGEIKRYFDTQGLAGAGRRPRAAPPRSRPAS
ncbi:MAG TPA: FAD-dependent monooxygenase [Beijerinckiaceae bacterium]|jgi:2-polyprenyl-6-methoxyphenol hydroxylase-like FAD-dependent oxidoreductase